MGIIYIELTQNDTERSVEFLNYRILPQDHVVTVCRHGVLHA